MAKQKAKKTSYNVRIVDNGDGTYSIGHVSRFSSTVKELSLRTSITGKWVEGSVNKMSRLLTKGVLK